MPDAATACHEFEADLSALLDDELTLERAAVLRAHSGACESCRGRLARLARVDAALAGAPAPAVSPTLRARLEARLASARQADTSSRRPPRLAPPRRAWRGRVAGALAAAAAGAALYLAVVTREPVRPEAVPAPVQIARPRVEPSGEIPPEAPHPVAKRPAPPLDLESVPEEELGLALEIETVEDLDVIGNLELLELVLASEAG